MKEDICEAIAQGFFGKNLLDKLEQVIVQPFVHNSNGYKTVVDSKESACVNLLTITEMTMFLGKRKRPKNFSGRAVKKGKEEEERESGGEGKGVKSGWCPYIKKKKKKTTDKNTVGGSIYKRTANCIPSN